MIRLFVAVFGGAVAWSLQLVVSYLLIGLACRPDAPLLPTGGTLTALLVAVSGLTLAGAVACAVVGARIIRSPAGPDQPAAGTNARGIAFVGVLLDLVFVVTIVIAASAIFFVPPC